MLPELKRPWEMIGGALAESAVAELLRELGPDHPLKDKNVQAVAERCDCDDVLFTLTEDKPACAVVHLTYTGKEERPNWPEIRLFASLDEWVRDCMIPDHDDYHAGE